MQNHVNKSFRNSIHKLDFIAIIKEIDLLNKLTLINFSKTNLENFKLLFSKIKNYIEYDEFILQIYLYLLDRKYNKLKKLFLNKIENLDLNILSKFLIRNKSIKILNLSRNKIGENECDLKYLSDALENNNSIKELYLNDNLIGLNRSDVDFISNIIRKNKSVDNFALGKNQIGANLYDVENIAESLKANTTIRSLFMEYNLIGQNERDLSNLEDLLYKNKSLKEIYLFGNIFNEEEGLRLREKFLNIDIFY